MVVPRQYQSEGIDAIICALSQYDRVLYILPTGGGKTVTFSLLSLAFSGRIMLMAHRTELIDQIRSTLERVCADMSRIHLDTVQTIARRMDKIERPDLIICDEAHHSVAGQYKKVFDYYKTKILGVTATPCRLDGRGLCEQYQDMILGPSMLDLIRLGNLVPSRIYSMPGPVFDGLKKRGGDYAKEQIDEAIEQVKPAIMGDVIGTYKSKAQGKKAVVFTHSVAMAKFVCDSFNAAGFRFSTLDGTMSKQDRAAVVAGIHSGDLDGIASCDIVSEGFDCPGLEVAILLRPTSSLSLYMQQVGRVLRPASGKEFGLVFDHVGNAHRFGPPDIDRVWSLEGKEQGRANRKNDVQIRTCTDCFAVIPQRSPRCPICNAERYTQEREIVKVGGELVLFEYGEKKEVLVGEKAMRYYDELQRIRKLLNKPLRNLAQIESVGIDRNTAWNMLRAAKKIREQTGENNMAYEQKNNSGSLFRNDRKEQPNHPDYKGSVMIDGVEMWVSAWVKEGNGKKFFSMSFTPKQAQAAPASAATAQDSDDLPF